MRVALTGGTGLVGSAVLRALVEQGHDVTALVRSDRAAEQVGAAGATAAVGDLTDAAWFGDQLEGQDGAIHTASPGDASSSDFDASVANAVVGAFGSAGKSYVHTGGAWVWGSGQGLTEQDPFHAPDLTAWRAGVEQVLLDADGLRAVVVAPGIVYGDGGGLANTVTKPGDDGSYRLIGDGSQHWTTVRTDQLADLYVRALTRESVTGYVIGANDDRPTVREIAEAAAQAAGRGEVVAETVEQSRDRLGAMLADALLLDQVASNARARDELGWNPTGESLLDQVRAGSYA